MSYRVTHCSLPYCCTFACCSSLKMFNSTTSPEYSFSIWLAVCSTTSHMLPSFSSVTAPRAQVTRITTLSPCIDYKVQMQWSEEESASEHYDVTDSRVQQFFRNMQHQQETEQLSPGLEESRG